MFSAIIGGAAGLGTGIYSAFQGDKASKRQAEIQKLAFQHKEREAERNQETMLYIIGAIVILGIVLIFLKNN